MNRTRTRTGADKVSHSRLSRAAVSLALSTAVALFAAPAAAAPSSVVLETSDATVDEGHDGVHYALFEIRRVGGFTGKAVTVTYSTMDGTATAGIDYQSAAGSLTFDKRDTVRTVQVAITGDVVPEPDEYFLLVVSDTGGGDGEGRGRILNDDGWPPDGAAR